MTFENLPHWELSVMSHNLPVQREGFLTFESSLVMRYPNLAEIRENELDQLLALETQGLRGVSVVRDESDPRAIRLRCAFVGQKGRTRDESENLVIDVLSLLRFARLLEDRIVRSSLDNQFSIELYHSQYVAQAHGHSSSRNRFVNYARNIFQGSAERVFGQVSKMLQDDYHYQMQTTGPSLAKVHLPEHSAECVLRIPEEVPMIVMSGQLRKVAKAKPEAETIALLRDLNLQASRLGLGGHFERSSDSTWIVFTTWKHLTNDLRYYALDHMIASIGHAADLLARRTKTASPTTQVSPAAPPPMEATPEWETISAFVPGLSGDAA
jgi:hypothetical protein